MILAEGRNRLRPARDQHELPDPLAELDEHLLECSQALASGPAEMLAATYNLREQRIRLLAAGAAIIQTVLDRVGVPAGRVVDTGIREGAIIAADRAGDAWRERLEELAHGWIA